MALIINGSQMPVNATVSHNGQTVNKIIYRHICENCEGTGQIFVASGACPVCNGTGVIIENEMPALCLNCGGDGLIDTSIPCEVCEESGFDVIETVWERLDIFTLTITKGIGVASVTVTRTFTKNSNASTGILTNGAEIYTDDVLTVSATAETGYELDPFTENYVVSGNITVHITATDTGPEQPYIWVTMEETPARRKYTAHFDNPNSASGTLYYSVDGGSSYSSTSISANGSYSLQVLTLMRGRSGSVDLRAYLVINGETSPTASYASTYSYPL